MHLDELQANYNSFFFSDFLSIQHPVSILSSSHSLHVVFSFYFMSCTWTLLLISVSDIVTSITDFWTQNFDPFIYLHQHIFLPAAVLLS